MYLIKRYKQRKAYKQYIAEHKRNVIKAFYEMIRCRDMEWILLDPEIITALWKRAVKHDDSKFDKEEFEYYRKHFFPVDEKERSKNETNFQKAWEHHKKVNDHHWQHRINWKDEDFNRETELACLENILDWMAMGYQFNDRPYDYYEANKHKINLPKKQKEFIERCIYQGVDKIYTLKKEGKWNELMEH